ATLSAIHARPPSPLSVCTVLPPARAQLVAEAHDRRLPPVPLLRLVPGPGISCAPPQRPLTSSARNAPNGPCVLVVVAKLPARVQFPGDPAQDSAGRPTIPPLSRVGTAGTASALPQVPPCWPSTSASTVAVLVT